MFGDWDLIRVKDLSGLTLGLRVDCSIEPIKKNGANLFRHKARARGAEHTLPKRRNNLFS